KKGKKQDKKSRLTKEMNKHNERIAKIDRLKEIADEKRDKALRKKAEQLRDKEMKRHQKALDRIEKAK
ncbi:MAG TPA: hypothetical protein PKX40_03600, partial [Spirochaetota bacterium]|nr:hypothetical protein [Spirochaetota bacterium]